MPPIPHSAMPASSTCGIEGPSERAVQAAREELELTVGIEAQECEAVLAEARVETTGERAAEARLGERALEARCRCL